MQLCDQRPNYSAPDTFQQAKRRFAGISIYRATRRLGVAFANALLNTIYARSGASGRRSVPADLHGPAVILVAIAPPPGAAVAIAAVRSDHLFFCYGVLRNQKARPGWFTWARFLMLGPVMGPVDLLNNPLIFRKCHLVSLNSIKGSA